MQCDHCLQERRLAKIQIDKIITYVCYNCMLKEIKSKKKQIRELLIGDDIYEETI